MSKHGPAGNTQVQAALAQQQRELGAEEENDLRLLLSEDWGRRLYYRLVYELCGLDSSSYAPSGQYMGFLEGRRDIGQTLKAEALDVAPTEWGQMLQERVVAAAEQALRAREATLSTETR